MSVVASLQDAVFGLGAIPGLPLRFAQRSPRAIFGSSLREEVRFQGEAGLPL